MNIIILIFCLPIFIQAQLPRLYDPQNGIFRFNGKVKSCKETEFFFQIKKDDTTKIRRKQNPNDLDFFVTINSKGKITEQIYYGKKDEIKETRKFQYDLADNLIKETTTRFRDSILRNKTVSYLYNSKGQLQKTEKELRDSSFKTKKIKVSAIIETFVYDSVGRKKEIVYVGASEIGRTTFKYNSTGELVEEKNFLPSKKLSNTKTYVYDGEHRCLEVKEIGESNYKIQFKYDSNEFPTEEVNYRNDRFIDKQVFKRDQYNNKTETQYHKANKLEYTLTFKFEYDANGNWTKKSVFFDNRLMWVIDRAFEYY